MAMVFGLVILAAAIAMGAYYQAGAIQAQTDSGTDPTIPAPPVPPTPTPTEHPVNSVYNTTVGESATSTLSWGTLTVEADTVLAGTASASSSSSSGNSTRAISSNPVGQEDVTAHTGLAKLRWNVNSWEADKPADRSVTAYRIERRHYFPSDRGPSKFETLVAIHPHNADNTEQEYNDYNVASRSIYEYQVTPQLDNGTELRAGRVRLNSGFRGNVEGYGVETGIQLHISYATHGVLADQEVRVYRSNFRPDGSEFVNGGSKIFTVDPATERIARIDTGVARNAYHGYRILVYETPPAETGEPERRVLSSDTVTMWASSAKPSAPLNLQASVPATGYGAYLSWTKPADRPAQVAQYEILRRSYLPLNIGDYAVVGTTKRTYFQDVTAIENGVYEYKVRTVTKQDTRGPASTSVIFPELTPLTCNTNYNTGETVSHLFADYDVFNADGEIKDIAALDVWAYADSSDFVGLERCTSLNTTRLKIKREIYFQHSLDDNECPNTSCHIVDTTSGTPPRGWET